MEDLLYCPDVYEGDDPYIHISYHPQDRAKVLGFLVQMGRRGYRFWMNDGIAPGMETDEIIAEHIEGCDFFIAFLSRAYLTFLDTVDELNYSRDVNKEYMLVYLEDVTLPTGLDMRFMRAQGVAAYLLSREDVCDKLTHFGGADRFYGIAEKSLRGSAQTLFSKLETLYPEHKVFALDRVAKQVSKQLSELYVKAGYPSAERLLLDYGFTQISTEQARLLRSSVLYQPGFEPEIVKPRIEAIIATLAADYPNRVITDVLSKSHKSVYQSLAGLSVWMGYDSIAAMMNAYGFSGVTSESGRIAVDYAQILKQIMQRYDGKKKPGSLMELIVQNPDMQGFIKTVSNRATELFGTTLLQYLKNIGFIVPREKQESLSATKRKELIENLRSLYDTSRTEYGTWEEAEQALDQLVLRKNSKGDIYITDCGSCDKTLKIPYGVAWIAEEAFAGQSDCKTLILPPTVMQIKEAAFADCIGLETIILPECLKRIDHRAFSGCTALRKVVLPKSLTAIGSMAFAGCEALSEVEFLNLRTNVQTDAFDGCPYKLEDLQDAGASPAAYFELKVDKKNNAKILAYTGNEEVVVIPQMIGGHPIVSIEKGAFKDNENVREVYISDCIGAINGDVFKECKHLEKLHLPESVTNLINSVFAGCISLTEVNIPDQMTEVQRGLFKDAPLTTLYVGKSVKRISPDAFYKGEIDIATGFYNKKHALENVIVDAANECLCAVGTMLLSKDGKVLLAELGNPQKAEIPEGVEEIGSMAYDKLSALKEVVFPASLRRIGEKAFAGTNLYALVLPALLTEIGPQAFSYCRSLGAVDFNDGLRVISQQAFEGCPIENVYISPSVEQLGSDAFLAISTYQGKTAQRFRIDPANEHLTADGIAYYQKDVGGVTLVKAYAPVLRCGMGEEAHPSVTYNVAPGTMVIAAHAFARCVNLVAVTLPDGLLSIGDMAFMDCTGLKEITLPQSCKDVSPKALFGSNAEIHS